MHDRMQKGAFSCGIRRLSHFLSEANQGIHKLMAAPGTRPCTDQQLEDRIYFVNQKRSWNILVAAVGAFQSVAEPAN
jgi:hypothetical protein